MGRNRLVGIVIAGAILVTSAGYCSGQEPSLDPTASRTAAGATLWSLEGARSKPAPQLLTATASGADTEARGSFWTTPPQATSPAATNTVCEHVSHALPRNDAGKCDPHGLLVSNVYPLIAGIPSVTGFGRDLTVNAQSIQESPYSKIAQYRLLSENDSVSPVSFLSSLETHYVLWEQAPADSTSLTDEGGTLLYPLLQVDLSGRRLPILLYVPALHGSSPNPRR